MTANQAINTLLQEKSDYYIQAYNVSKESVYKILTEIQPSISELERKKIMHSVDYGDVMPLSLHTAMDYILSTLNFIYGDGEVDKAINSPDSPIAYMVNFFDDCYRFLEDGALLPGVLNNYIKIHRNRHDAVLNEQLDSIDSTVGYYKGDYLDADYTTVCFDMAVSTVAACYKL